MLRDARHEPEDGAAPPRLAHLDGWRGLSILLVLVGHFTPAHRAAHLGVEMFFALSGRLMAEILIDRRQPLGIFVWRRVVRVWPALWTYVALVAGGLSVSYALGDQRNVLAGAAAMLSFTINYVAADVSVPYFDHGWSLAVEEHGYLLLAAIAWAAGRRPRAAAVAALALAALAMANGAGRTLIGGENPYYAYLRSDVRVASVLLPFALFLFARHGRGAAWWPWLAPVAAVAAVALGTLDPGWPRFVVATAAIAVATVALDTAPAAVRRWLAAAPLRWLGALSFSLYLWQQPFMMLRRAGAPGLLCLAAAVLVGAWSYYRVERPARRRLASWSPAGLRRRFSRTATDRACAGSPPASA